MLNWKDDDTFTLGESTFHVVNSMESRPPPLGEEDFVLFKPRAMVERYITLVEELEPQHMFELGMFGGGSTLFFAKLARPRTIVAIDREPADAWRKRIDQSVAAEGLASAVVTFGGVDQADRARLAEIADEAFEGAPLDLVIDDCSHMYEETRDSFNELFPRLRPGGIYVIEDWYWAHTAVGEAPPGGLYPDRVPLTQLLFEIVLAIPGSPGLVGDISIERDMAVVTRGDADVDPATFEISACSNPRGRALLATDQPTVPG